MAFNGIYPAPALSPLEFGLFSAADVTRHSVSSWDEKWIRGFSVEFDTNPTLRVVSTSGATACVVNDGSRAVRWFDVNPFFIEAEDFRSAFSVTGEDRFARVLKQLEGSTQKCVEDELWSGHCARETGSDDLYLARADHLNTIGTTPGTAVSYALGLSLLEYALSNSPTGEQGVIHLTRDVAAFLGTQGALSVSGDKIVTINGTPISAGAGNSGDGPAFAVTNAALATNVVTLTTATPHLLATGESVEVTGIGAPYDGTYTVASTPTSTTLTYAKTNANVASAPVTGFVQMLATSDVKWIYATGAVSVHLGKSEVVNDTLAQGWDVVGNDNDLRIKATRPAVVYFDPTLHYGIKVDMTA